MKKILTLVLFLAIGSTTLFAEGGEKVSKRFETALAKSFSDAKNVNWEYLNNEEILHASFTLGNDRMNAFFDQDGKLIATGRFINQSDLPLLVSRGLARYTAYTIENVVEYISGNETSYIVNMESAKHKIVVQAYASGSNYIFKKEKKKS